MSTRVTDLIRRFHAAMRDEFGDEAPKHDCEFHTNPEKGACNFHETWADFVSATPDAILAALAPSEAGKAVGWEWHEASGWRRWSYAEKTTGRIVGSVDDTSAYITGSGLIGTFLTTQQAMVAVERHITTPSAAESE